MLHVGVCNVTVEQLALARSVVEIATVQSPFNLADTSRADLLAGQVALAWLLARSPVILPISGAASAAHLEANGAAASLCLDDEEVLAIGRAAG